MVSSMNRALRTKLFRLLLRPKVVINWLVARYSSQYQKDIVQSRPVTLRIAPANLCNYGCLFCEIHKDDAIWPKRSKNILNVGHIKFFSEFLRGAYRLDFCGGSAEPLLAKEFGEIVIYLKKAFGLVLGVTTNASTISEKLAKTLVAWRFDHLLVSYHAGTPDGYRWLMTGDIDKVNTNIERITTLKNKNRRREPVIKFNFALHRENKEEFEAVLNQAEKLHVQAVQVSKYYGGFNKLQHLDVGYDNDPDEGNATLDAVYKRAEGSKVQLEPPIPDYWQSHSYTEVWDPEDVDHSIHCHLPWTHAQFNPVLDEPGKLYMGVCNRINLFKIRVHDVATEQVPALSIDAWNHPVLRHLRSTVNNAERINPICKFCKSRGVGRLRVKDAAMYAGLRDDAVRRFFIEAKSKGTRCSDSRVEVLSENPYDHETHSEALTGFLERNKPLAR